MTRRGSWNRARPYGQDVHPVYVIGRSLVVTRTTTGTSETTSSARSQCLLCGQCSVPASPETRPAYRCRVLDNQHGATRTGRSGRVFCRHCSSLPPRSNSSPTACPVYRACAICRVGTATITVVRCADVSTAIDPHHRPRRPLLATIGVDEPNVVRAMPDGSDPESRGERPSHIGTLALALRPTRNGPVATVTCLCIERPLTAIHPQREPYPDIALFHPRSWWKNEERALIKGLLLFFDGVALLAPGPLRERAFNEDVSLAQPLRDLGLFHILDQDATVDAEMEAAVRLALWNLPPLSGIDPSDDQPLWPDLQNYLKDHGNYIISKTRMYSPDVDKGARRLAVELASRGLLDRIELAGRIWHVEPAVGAVASAVSAQLLRLREQDFGLRLHPATASDEVSSSLAALLRAPNIPGAAGIVRSDLRVVGVDLEDVPLSEILEFRDEHGADYRRYASQLRAVVRIASTESQEAESILRERSRILIDEAQHLSELQRRRWKGRSASLSLGIAGAAWAATSGDFLSAILGIGAVVAGEVFSNNRVFANEG